MRLGISSYTYGWGVGTKANRPPNALSALDLVARAVEFRVRVLQLCDNLPAETYEHPYIDRLALAASESNLDIQLGARGLHRDVVRRMLDACRAVRSPVLRLVIDTPGDHPDEPEVVRRLKALLPDLAAANVVLAIENHDRFPAAALRRIIESTNSPHVGVCLDTANSFGALEGPEAVVETLGPLTVNLHLKDIAVNRVPSLQGFNIEGRPAGKGMLNIPWTLSRLRAMGRDPDAIIELWTPPEPSMVETIEKESQWAAASVQTLRPWIPD